MNVEYAKELQLQLYCKRQWGLGPKWMTATGGVEEFEDLRDEIARLLAPHIKRHNFQRVPSAWHASLLLRQIQDITTQTGSPAWVYRGQSNSKWSIQPSLFRDGVDQDAEIERLYLFENLMGHMSFNCTSIFYGPMGSPDQLNLRVGKNAYRASAQHYGLKTPLVDLTTDPDVAIFFALNGPTAQDGLSTVYCRPIGPEMEIILPPPMVQRLYVQSGLFAGRETSFEKGFAVQFPKSGSESFQVLREGGKPVDLVPQETWLDPVVDMVERMFAKEIPSDSREDFVDAGRQLMSSYDAFYENPIAYWMRYVEHFEDFGHDLFLTPVDGLKGVNLDYEILDSVIRSNIEVSASIAQLYRWMMREHGDHLEPMARQWQENFAVRLDQIVGESGYAHDSELRSFMKRYGLQPSPAEKPTKPTRPRTDPSVDAIEKPSGIAKGPSEPASDWLRALQSYRQTRDESIIRIQFVYSLDLTFALPKASQEIREAVEQQWHGLHNRVMNRIIKPGYADGIPEPWLANLCKHLLKAVQHECLLKVEGGGEPKLNPASFAATLWDMEPSTVTSVVFESNRPPTTMLSVIPLSVFRKISGVGRTDLGDLSNNPLLCLEEDERWEIWTTHVLPVAEVCLQSSERLILHPGRVARCRDSS